MHPDKILVVWHLNNKDWKPQLWFYPKSGPTLYIDCNDPAGHKLPGNWL